MADQRSLFSIDTIDQAGLSAVAVTFSDPLPAIEMLQQSEALSPYWGFLIDMDHETVFFDAGQVDVEALGAVIEQVLGEAE